MRKIVVSVKDLKAQEYLFLLLYKTDAEAQRSYLQLLEQPNAPFGRHPRDYALHQLGILDTETGILARLDAVNDLTPYNELDAITRRTNDQQPLDREPTSRPS